MKLGALLRKFGMFFCNVGEWPFDDLTFWQRPPNANQNLFGVGPGTPSESVRSGNSCVERPTKSNAGACKCRYRQWNRSTLLQQIGTACLGGPQS